MVFRVSRIEIEPIGPARAEFVRDLSDVAFAPYGDYRVLLPAMMADPAVTALAAFASGQPIGFAMYAVDDDLPGWVEVVAIAVVEAWRGQGVGRRLLAAVESRVGGDGTPVSMVATTAIDNAPARALFEAAGFRRAPWPSGRYDGGQRAIDLVKPPARGTSS